ncbi:hypothetical protein GGR88_000018 [Sphingomonas jejuensis]|uniref:Amidohydrolase 3 domain-containing protein n=1 Tax=Sphingomonas jejuensis TaxID=904715 RepID=A0ABX0XI73_9SPHN|nr:amidohydrolase [Sphingomonas jejuensis]NJC32544.1 hypothetical protein [Sphingomonas jejuensis]
MRSALLCAAIALAAIASPAAAEQLIDNVNGITLDARGRVVRFTGLVIDDEGKVERLLERGDRRPERPDTRLDARGRTLMPGFIDAHGHVMGLGFSALTLDLTPARTLAEAQRLIADYAAANPQRPWIIGRGWNQESWGLGRFPTAADLDQVVADRPVWLERVDGHAGWANSAAMRAAGITEQTEAPAGGRIEKTGRAPNGIFVDAAAELVQRVVPVPSPKDRDAALARAQDILLRLGITTIADMGTSLDDWMTFRRAGDEDRLGVRILSYASSVPEMLTIAGPRPTPWLYGDRLRMLGVKIYADGALGSRGAWLIAPYHDAPNTSGLSLIEDTRLRNLMSRATMDGFQVAIHAIGDRANRQVLDAIAELAESYPGGDRRWRVEHAQVLSPADLPRLAQHGTIASMQPIHQVSDRQMAEARLGPERLSGAYAWATVLRDGGRLAFGSDVPVESADPLAGFAAAISREGSDGQPAGGWQPQEKVTREQALAGFTTGGAFAGFAEDRLGRLAPGMQADFVLIDGDPLEASPAEIRAMRVAETWVGGRRRFVRR